jgi:hypothetical protein
MKKTAIIIGSLVVLGIGAYFYFRPKAKAEDGTGADTTGTGTGTTGAGTTGAGTTGVGTTTPPPPVTEVKTLTPNELIEVTKLKDAILSDIRTRNSYRKASSRANVQSEIDKKLILLKNYGFSLNTNNELIKTS